MKPTRTSSRTSPTWRPTTRTSWTATSSTTPRNLDTIPAALSERPDPVGWLHSVFILIFLRSRPLHLSRSCEKHGHFSQVKWGRSRASQWGSAVWQWANGTVLKDSQGRSECRAVGCFDNVRSHSHESLRLFFLIYDKKKRQVHDRLFKSLHFNLLTSFQ